MISLNPKQRRFLKQHAHHLKPVMQVGKEGPSSGFLSAVDEQLEIHELLKIKVLKSCLDSESDIRCALESKGAAVVQKVGNIFTIFRQRSEDSGFSL